MPLQAVPPLQALTYTLSLCATPSFAMLCGSFAVICRTPSVAFVQMTQVKHCGGRGIVVLFTHGGDGGGGGARVGALLSLWLSF